MEKISNFDMDLEEWELLPKDDHPKSVNAKEAIPPLYSRGEVDLDYFAPSEILLGSVMEPSTANDHEDEKSIMAIEDSKDDLDENSQSLVNKIDGDGFDVMKVESRWEEWSGAEEREKQKEMDHEIKGSGSEEEEEEEREFFCSKLTRKGFWGGMEFHLWGWKFHGIGALCTIGVAAASICIFMLVGRDRQKYQHQKIPFQIYAEDKNLKEVVQHATRLNHALSAARGVPMTRADISFGGYYSGF